MIKPPPPPEPTNPDDRVMLGWALAKYIHKYPASVGLPQRVATLVGKRYQNQELDLLVSEVEWWIDQLDANMKKLAKGS